MSRTLTVVDAGLDAATALARAGRGRAAQEALAAVLARTDLTPGVAGRAHREAAALALRGEQYRRARRHLRAAAELDPADAGVQYDLGRANENDPYGCDRRAANRYRKATQLDATQPKYRAALGRAMVRINETRSGVKVLLRAAAAAPVDAEVLTIVAEGLREAGQSATAFRLLSQARFLAPADRGIAALWNRAKFDATAEHQKRSRRTEGAMNATAAPAASKVIPFLRLHNDAPASPQRKTRADGPNVATSHLGRLRAFRAE